jgi:hypothetical protein
MNRSRNWVLTINYKENDPMTNEELLEIITNIKGIVYTSFQFEQGEQGTYHHQAYISFKNAKTFDTIKKIFPSAHIEKMQGTPQQASEYCTKEDTRISDSITWGELPIQGKRSDLEDIYSMIKNGCDLDEIRDLYPGQYIRYMSKIHEIYQEILEEKYKKTFRNVEVIYLHDKPGIGKTRYIMEKYGYENVHRVSNYKHPFDTYHAQNVLVLEEFRSSLPIEEMLHYLDGYPIRLPARYSDKVACYEKVYIVSNWIYEQQYENIQAQYPETYQAFERRINFIGNLEQIKRYEESKEVNNDEDE